MPMCKRQARSSTNDLQTDRLTHTHTHKGHGQALVQFGGAWTTAQTIIITIIIVNVIILILIIITTTIIIIIKLSSLSTCDP